MIWFACKQCGKVHGRPEASAGATVFCDCGQGNLVPWESTAAEPESAPVADAPALPALQPLTFEAPPRPSDPGDEPRPRRARERRDPEFCFNHQRVPKVGTCAD